MKLFTEPVVAGMTLNMLLSFAQFEREVTGERIRDKLAATKKKGLWITGQPPLGYRTVEHVLTIIPEEAVFVRRMYEDYLNNQSPIDLATRYNSEGLTTRRWTSPSSGRSHGGRPLTPKWVYRILTNPVYIGKITHKEHVWPGQHEPIIPQALWQQVQDAIQKQDRQTRHRWTHTHLLKGKIRTYEGFTMSPSMTQRPAVDGGSPRLVRYYISQKAMQQSYKNCLIKAINGDRLDDLIRAMVMDHLQKRENYIALHVQEPQVRDHWLREIIHRVTVAPSSLTVELNMAQIEACKTNQDLQAKEGQAISSQLPICVFEPKIEQRGQLIQLTLAIQIKRLDGKRMLLSPGGQELVVPNQPEPRPHIVTAIGKAYLWKEELEKTGLPILRFAEREGVCEAQVRKLLPLVNLSPAILKWALTGDLPRHLTLDDLLHAGQDLDWNRQTRDLGIEQKTAPATAVA